MENFIEKCRSGELDIDLFVRECIRCFDEWDADDFRTMCELFRYGQSQRARREAEEAAERQRRIEEEKIEKNIE